MANICRQCKKPFEIVIEREPLYSLQNSSNICDKCYSYYKTYITKEGSIENMKQSVKKSLIKNKTKYEQHRKEHVTCECGTQVRRACLRSHKGTRKHFKLIV